jgi:phosphatidylglycerophosphatase A
MKRLIASCFGLGWLPVAPGTWGSLPPVLIFTLVHRSNASPALTLSIMAALAIVGSVICVLCAPASITATGKADPREVVADEFAGQALTFLVAGTIANSSLWLPAVGGFLAFRFFDIVKPWPARRLEKLPEGWGILADDLSAAVYAGLALLISLKLWVK